MPNSQKVSIPLGERWWDVLFILFFIINLVFVTYAIDLETLLIADPKKFSYPVWPPKFMVDLTHWWGRTFDPVLLARPPWWKATIWIDVLLFGPFYLAAIYAYARGCNWIRVPSLVYSGLLFANVAIILTEEMYGYFATPRPLAVWLANLPWLLFPVLIILRMAFRNKPFTQSYAEINSRAKQE